MVSESELRTYNSLLFESNNIPEGPPPPVVPINKGGLLWYKRSQVIRNIYIGYSFPSKESDIVLLFG